MLAFLTIISALRMSGGERTWFLSSIAICALYVGNFFGFVSSAHHDLAPAVGRLWSLAKEVQFSYTRRIACSFSANEYRRAFGFTIVVSIDIIPFSFKR